MELLVDLNLARWEPDPSLLGGKGANLLKLVQGGLPVPRAMCLTADAYRVVLQRAVEAADPTPSSPDELRGLLEAAPLPAEVGAALARAYAALKDGPGLPRLAVRSSSTTEDSTDASHAGQAATFLNVTGFEDLVRAVRGCWASLWSQEHLAYRHRNGRPGDVMFVSRAPAMAVVIQTMVPSEVAGVLFTADPVSGRTDRMVVSAAWGLGETVVSGRAADTVIMDRTGRVLQEQVADKQHMLEQAPDGGVRSRAVDRERAQGACVPREVLIRLAALGRSVERILGPGQDIEWALVDDRIHLLQARPITVRPAGGRDAGEPQVWSNVNVGEALPGVASPMTWSIIHRFSRRGLEQAFGALGLDVPEGYGMVGNVNGRIYLNLSEFMSVASGVPFMTPRLLARVAGSVDPEIMAGAYRKVAPFRFVGRLPLSALRMAASQLTGPGRVKGHQRLFDDVTSRFDALDLSALDREGLHRAFLELGELFDLTGELLLAVSSNALASYILVQLVVATGGRAAVARETDLFTGLRGLSSAQPGLALLDLAHLARDLGLGDLLTDMVDRGADPEEILQAVRFRPGGGTFCARFREFLDKHGHRATREAELSVPRWREDPSFPLEVIATHLRARVLEDSRERQARQARSRRTATERVRSLLPRVARPLFDQLLPLAQKAARLRERMRSMVTKTIGMYRTLFLEVGTRLERRGIIPSRDRVFFLTIQEIRAMLEHGYGFVLDTVLEREARFHAQLAMPDPPNTFRVFEGEQVPMPRAEAPSGADRHQAQTLRGLGCSAGRVTGVARVLSSPGEAGRLGPGEVLVARSTDVGWTPLFLVAGALVLDQGGPLSHAAVVAREYGLPAVVDTKVATSTIRDGDLVSVDGREGVVEVYRKKVALEDEAMSMKVATPQ